MSLTSYRAAPSRDRVVLCVSFREIRVVFARFGGDLLSHVLRRSTIGATALNGRVRNGAGCFARAMTTKPRKNHDAPQVRRVAGSVSRSDNALPHPDMPGASFSTPLCFRIRVVVHVITLTVCMLLIFRREQVGTCLLLDQIKPIGPLVPVN
jgi:hypothetical protein